MAEPYQSVRPNLYERFRRLLRIPNTLSDLFVLPVLVPTAPVVSNIGVSTEFDVVISVNPVASQVLGRVPSAHNILEDGIYDVKCFCVTNTGAAGDFVTLRILRGFGNVIDLALIELDHAANSQMFEYSVELREGDRVEVSNNNIMAANVFCNLALGKR